MTSALRPHSRHLDLGTGVLHNTRLLERRLSDMSSYYADQKAVQELLAENPLIYQVYDAPIPEREGELCHCTTVLKPGRVGDEYFMTKGHHHEVDSAEIYYILSGSGYLVMETRDGQASELAVGPGSIAYIPPGWAHRTVNTGDSDMVFYCVWFGNGGHDYASIATKGFLRRIVAAGGVPAVIDRSAK